jgi:glycosyltransferase involved in cell wall biosynthesis
LLSTVYDERDKKTNELISQYKITKPIEVLFEGVDTSIYNNVINKDFKLDIKEDFAFLFVGHWLKGNIGQDRKDIGMLIKCFVEAFKDGNNMPALVLKTSSSSFSIKEREVFIKRIKDIVSDIKNPPSIYLLFGDLTNKEMNDLYNHPKIKLMVSLTKGEGFGRPLLEFTMTGKPVMASNWSGHKDFLPVDKSIMVGGKLTDVDDSAIDQFIIKGSKWFTANYGEVAEIMKIVRNDYSNFLLKSLKLKEENSENFSLEKMKERFLEILKPYIVAPTPVSQHTKLILPKLNKVK